MDGELQLLRTVTNPKIEKRKRLTMLGQIQKNMFHHEFTETAFSRVLNMVQTRNHLMDWQELVRDPSLDRDARDLFEDTDVKPCRNPKAYAKLVEDIDQYRRRREVFDLVNEMADRMSEGESFDADELLEEATSRIGKIRENAIEEETMWNFGLNDNSDEIIERALFHPTEKMWKTGFKEYDDRNGGLPTTGVMIMAATTSGGKSVVSSNLEKNLALCNEDLRATKITLEMSEEQEANRILSMISGVDFSKIKRQQLSDREQKKIKKDMQEWRDKLKANNSQFSYLAGKKSRTIDQLLSMLVAYAFNIIIIDYISLLEGVDDDNQWRMLSSVARSCKVFASEHNCLIILLAQLDTESSKIRYSQGIKEHADVVWKWNYANEEVRATHVIPIEIDKVRDGELFTMPVAEDFSRMRVDNPEDADLEVFEEFRNAKQRGGRKKKGDEDDENENKSKSRRRSRSRSSESEDSKDDESSSRRSSSRRGSSRRKRKDDDLVLG